MTCSILRCLHQFSILKQCLCQMCTVLIVEKCSVCFGNTVLELSHTETCTGRHTCKRAVPFAASQVLCAPHSWCASASRGAIPLCELRLVTHVHAATNVHWYTCTCTCVCSCICTLYMYMYMDDVVLWQLTEIRQPWASRSRTIITAVFVALVQHFRSSIIIINQVLDVLNQ